MVERLWTPRQMTKYKHWGEATAKKAPIGRRRSRPASGRDLADAFRKIGRRVTLGGQSRNDKPSAGHRAQGHDGENPWNFCGTACIHDAGASPGSQLRCPRTAL